MEKYGSYVFDDCISKLGRQFKQHAFSWFAAHLKPMLLDRQMCFADQVVQGAVFHAELKKTTPGIVDVAVTDKQK